VTESFFSPYLKIKFLISLLIFYIFILPLITPPLFFFLNSFSIFYFFINKEINKKIYQKGLKIGTNFFLESFYFEFNLIKIIKKKLNKKKREISFINSFMKKIRIVLLCLGPKARQIQKNNPQSASGHSARQDYRILGHTAHQNSQTSGHTAH
jgi:hypothetical protein